MSIHARETATGRRYDVKLRGPDGQQYSKTFATKRAAADYEAHQWAAAADGLYMKPKGGSTTLATLGVQWLATGSKRESTQARDRAIVAMHVVSGLGSEQAIRTVTKADCQALVDSWSAAGQAPRTVSRQYSVLRAMFQHAVDAELIMRNPASRVRLPHPNEVVRPGLKAGQLENLAEVLGRDQAPFMWCGALLGLRWAEAAGLTAGSLDLVGGTITVKAQLDRHGRLVAPKTQGSVRTLAAPAWLLDDLDRLLQGRHVTGADSGVLVFVNQAGNGLSYTNWRTRVWQPATTAACLAGLRYHDLRSIAASALVASGVDLRTAMHRLGHTTPAMTLAVYARVAQDRDREAAEAVAIRVAPDRARHPS